METPRPSCLATCGKRQSHLISAMNVRRHKTSDARLDVRRIRRILKHQSTGFATPTTSFSTNGETMYRPPMATWVFPRPRDTYTLCSFYTTFNTVFGKIARWASERMSTLLLSCRNLNVFIFTACIPFHSINCRPVCLFRSALQ